VLFRPTLANPAPTARGDSSRDADGETLADIARSYYAGRSAISRRTV
jgi:hypothetical protein